MSTKQPLLHDYFAARKYEFTPPGFAASSMSSTRSPLPNILPLVDDRGFLITLIPEDHRLYREAYNLWVRGYPDTLFETALNTPMPDFMEFKENGKEDTYKKIRCSLRTFRQRRRDGSEYILYVLMTPDLCEELFDDGSLPDLRGVFR